MDQVMEMKLEWSEFCQKFTKKYECIFGGEVQAFDLFLDLNTMLGAFEYGISADELRDKPFKRYLNES